MRIYIDGIFDLFHIGHANSFLECKKLHADAVVVVGVIGDDAAQNYKRRPIIPEEERYELVKQNVNVDEVILRAPLVITKEFMDQYKIDLVVHGFANKEDSEKQDAFFKVPKALGKFQIIKYYGLQSATKIIKKIQ